MKYINVKTRFGVETVDEVNPENFTTLKQFFDECNRLLNEYRMDFRSIDCIIYLSQKSTKEWRQAWESVNYWRT